MVRRLVQKINGKKPIVFIGLSGGVDSSVSAALLLEQGYDVVGVFMKVWQPDFIECTWREERRDAMRVAAHLNIPFLTFDLEQEYKQGVADYMISEYKAGRTPNPDVMCNKEVKFGAFLKKARAMGADYIATGHYAQNTFDKKLGAFSMRKSADSEKDQTYFLWTLGQEELAYTLFPIGHLTKPEVRKLAKRFGLPTEQKKDSQGVCFLGKLDMKEFLGHYIPKKRGIVIDETGREIGTHDGAVFYTIGERHGFHIDTSSTNEQAHYIVEKDIKKNTLTVSTKPRDQFSESAKEIKLESVRWSQGVVPDTKKKYMARLRYRQELASCRIQVEKAMCVVFDTPEIAASSGQSLVLYDDDICLGGGVIV